MSEQKLHNNGIGQLLDENGRILSNNSEKTDVRNICFYS